MDAYQNVGFLFIYLKIHQCDMVTVVVDGVAIVVNFWIFNVSTKKTG